MTVQKYPKKVFQESLYLAEDIDKSIRLGGFP